MLEHLRNPEKAIKKVNKGLIPDGVFIGSVPNNFGFWGTFATFTMSFFDRTHVSSFSTAKWQRIFEETFVSRNTGKNGHSYAIILFILKIKIGKIIQVHLSLY